MTGRYTLREIIQRPLFLPLLILITGILAWDHWILPRKADRSFQEEALEYEGIVLEQPAVSEEKTRLTVRVAIGSAGKSPPAPLFQRGGLKVSPFEKGGLRGIFSSSPIESLILLTLIENETPFRRGDRIRFQTRLKVPASYKNPGGFDYARYLHRQGIFATGFIKGPADISVIQPARLSPLMRWMEGIKGQTKNQLVSLAGPPRAGVLIALLWGDESLLDFDTEKLFRDHGINHLLVISGLHFATLSFLVFHLFMACVRLFPRLLLSLPMRKIAAGATMIPLTLYFLFCESSPSITRAFIAVMAYLAAMILNRSRDLLNIIFLAAFVILLIRPSDLFNLSFQLSFGAVLCLALILPLLTNLFGKKPAPKGVGWLRELILVNAAVFVGLTPVLAFYFHRLSLDSFVMNLWAVPLIELIIVPVGLVALVLGIVIPAVALFLFTLDIHLIDAALWILNRAASLFGEPMLVFTPRGWELALYFFLLLTLVFKIRPQFQKIAAMVVAGIFLFDGGLRLTQIYGADRFRITQIDVGQGDSLLVELPGPKRVLIDGGGSPFFDLGENVVIPFLLHRRIPKLDAVVVTHADTDHYLGLKAVLESYRVDEIWWNGVADEEPVFVDLFETAKRKGIKIVELTKGMKFSLGAEDRWEVLSPGTQDKIAAKDNNRSLVLRLESGGHSALFTGDLESWGEFKLANTVGAHSPKGPLRGRAPLHADYLKVGHHGSKTSSSEEFLKAVSPQVATIGVGVRNRFHHPSSEVINRFEVLDIPVYRTDRDGAITVDFDEEGIEVKTTVTPASPTTEHPTQAAESSLR